MRCRSVTSDRVGNVGFAEDREIAEPAPMAVQLGDQALTDEG